MAMSALPRRDGEARARLAAVGERVRPVTLARDRALEVPDALTAVFPGGVQRGATVVVDGHSGAGATTLAFELASTVTATGEWAAAVDLDGTLGAEAAASAGVALERFAVLPRVSPQRWATVVAALLDGVSLVLAETPRSVGVGDARRLVARARERDAVLVAVGRWPADASVRLHAAGGEWRGIVRGAGLLAERARSVHVEREGAVAIARVS